MEKLKIPFNDNHEMIKSHTSYRGTINWIDNYTFKDTMIVSELVRMGHSAYYTLISKTDSKQYALFLSEMLIVAKSTIINMGEITGEWTFRKKGQDYSLKFIG